ncbi:MAG: hypothetical protein M0C28_07945 [Candidatus Moduliflexus flocculans]|nr:hypothetical protein [Candidatus Moduliflexus flocculans]
MSLSLTRGRLHAAPLFLRLACFNRLVWSDVGLDAPGSLARVLEGAHLRSRLPEGRARIGALRAHAVGERWARALIREQGLPVEIGSGSRRRGAWRARAELLRRAQRAHACGHARAGAAGRHPPSPRPGGGAGGLRRPPGRHGPGGCPGVATQRGRPGR